MTTQPQRRSLLVSWTGLAVLLVSISLAASCGLGHDDDVDAAEIDRLQELSEDVEALADDHAAAMDSPEMNSAADCRRTYDEYHARVRPKVEQMHDSSPRMDRFMHDHGAGSSADMHCATKAMIDELDHHAEKACATNEPDTMRREARRHRDTMHQYTDHVEVRCEGMRAAHLDHHHRDWGGRLEGCPAYDGGDYQDAMCH